MATTDKLLTVFEAAALLGYKPGTVRARIWKREWPYVKLGRSVRLKESFINRLIGSNEIPVRTKEEKQ